LHPAEQYAHDVVSGEIPAGELIRKACQRHIDDMEHGPERGIYFDENAGQHAIDFFGFLRHSKGKWANDVFQLEPWQQFIVWSLFGWHRADGTRRFRVAYIEIPRKNGKSTLLAGIGLYLFFADGEQGAEVYSAATKREQAKIIHSEATNMVKKSPALRSRIKMYRDNMHIISTSSKFEPLGADSGTSDGLNIHAALVDELHAHKDRGMWDVLDTATGARQQPLIAAITTAGYDRHTVCYEQHEYSVKVLDDVIEDDEHFCFIASVDNPEKWDDETEWAKANPNLGVSVSVDDLRRKAKKAKEQPAARNAFKRLHLNIWTEAETLWLDLTKWDANGLQTDYDDLIGRKCYGGLDLSSTIDITAFVLVFPRDDAGYDVLCYFWVPGESMIKRAKKDRVPYPVWAEQGFIERTDGDVVDYHAVRSKIIHLSELFDIQEIAYDRWNSSQIVSDLLDEGADMVPLGQGFASMSAPSKELERLVLAGQFHHGGNPVLRWMASNTVVQTDPAGNIKPAKNKSTEKIDGIVAAIMALSMAMAHDDEPKHESPYTADRGVLAI